MTEEAVPIVEVSEPEPTTPKKKKAAVRKAKKEEVVEETTTTATRDVSINTVEEKVENDMDKVKDLIEKSTNIVFNNVLNEMSTFGSKIISVDGRVSSLETLMHDMKES